MLQAYFLHVPNTVLQPILKNRILKMLNLNICYIIPVIQFLIQVSRPPCDSADDNKTTCSQNHSSASTIPVKDAAIPEPSLAVNFQELQEPRFITKPLTQNNAPKPFASWIDRHKNFPYKTSLAPCINPDASKHGFMHHS